MNKTVRIISNAVYSLGAVIAFSLVCITLFGSTQIINPDAMLPRTWKVQAFIWLALGTMPMLLACTAVYKFNVIKNSLHKKRYFFLIFLPGFICAACALFIIALLIAGMVNNYLLH